MRQLFKDFIKGVWKENPTFVLTLGMCPTLAVTSNALNGASMGIATTFVLALGNLVISLIRKTVPNKIRIPVYIVVIAALVTIIEMLMKAYAPTSICESLGIFIPLIVVNCIVLGRAEAFASKNGPLRSFFDGLGMGAGFTLSLSVIGCLREFLSTGSLFDVKMITAWTTDFMLPSSAPGAFIILGCLMALMNYMNFKKSLKSGKVYIPPAGLDCKHCNICSLNSEEEKE